MFLASENIDFTGLSHVFLLGGGEKRLFFCVKIQKEKEKVMKAKRLTALLLLVVTLIGMLPGAALAANTPGEALGEIYIYNGGEQLA